jgi:hypothetical protein
MHIISTNEDPGLRIDIISTDEDPGLRIESFAVINLRGVSTNKTIITITCNFVTCITKLLTALKLICFTLQVYTSKLIILVKPMVVSCKKEEIYFNELMV